MAIHCHDIDTLGAVYLDGELQGHELHDLEHHLGMCPVCATRIARERADLERMRALLAGPTAPPALRRSLSALLDREDRAQLASRRHSLGWLLPVAASLAAAASLAVFALDSTRPTVSGTARMSAQVVQKEAVENRYRGQSLMVQGTTNEIARSVGEYLRVPARTPRFARADTSLRGWTPTQLAGKVAARLVYEATVPSGRHLIEVHVLDARELALDGSEPVTVDGTILWVSQALGFNTVTFVDRHAVGYVFASEMPRDQLVELVAGSDLLQLVHQKLDGD